MSQKEHELHGDELVKTHYWQLHLKAIEQLKNGRKREALNMFRECLTLSPTKWSNKRFDILCTYGSMLSKDDVPVTKEDTYFLEKEFVENDAEPNIFRLMAAVHVYGLRMIKMDEVEEAMSMAKMAVAFSKVDDPCRLKVIKASRSSSTGAPQLRLVQDLYSDLKDTLEGLEKKIKYYESTTGYLDTYKSPSVSIPRALKAKADFILNHTDKMDKLRYLTMEELCFTLGHMTTESSQEYVSWLEKNFASNTEEPMVFRCRAACALLQLAWKRGDDKAVEKYRKVARTYIAQTSDEERTAKVRTLRKNFDPEGARPMDATVRQVYKDLTELYLSDDGPKQDQATLTNIFTQEELDNIMHLEKMDFITFQRRMMAGGDDCDFCEQAKEDVGLSRLAACARCKQASYCSRDCQQKHWEAGHKTACRKPEGDIHPGDLMKLVNLAKKEFNLRVVKVIRADPNKQERWEVMFFDNGKTANVSIASEKLMHIRPLA